MEKSSEDKICCNARFMQPLIPNFLNSFSIPVAFVTRLKEELKLDPLKSVMLTTKDEPHLHWKVDIEGGRHFKDGWKEFADNHALKVGDFVVFTYMHHSIFQVSVFDPCTACERLSGSKTETDGLKFNSDDGISGKKRARVTQVQGKPSAACQITLSNFAYNKSTIFLSKYFTRSSGLEKKSCYIKLIDREGRDWKVKLNCRKSDGNSYICGGWKVFQAANNFKPGDVISFQFLEKSGGCPTMKCYRLKRRRKC